MAVQVKTGTFAAPTTLNSTFTVTGVGFKPKLVILLWASKTSSTGAIDTAADANIGIGWMINDNADGAPIARRACVRNSEDAAASGIAGCRMQNDAVLCEMLNGKVMTGLLDGQSFNTDGFVVICDDAMTALRVHYIAIGGDDITNIASGRELPPNVTGNVTYTGPGFQPDFVFLVGCRGTTENANHAHGVFTVGAAVSSTKRAVCADVSFDANATMFTEGYGFDGEVLAFPLPAAVNPQTLQARADFVGFTATGFTLNWLEAVNPNASQFMWLAIKGGSWDLLNGLTLTDTTSDIAFTHGFQPRGGMVVSHQRAKSTQDTMQLHAGLSVGVWDSATSERCISYQDEDAAATALCAQLIDEANVLATQDIDLANPAQAVTGKMHVNSVTTTGVNFRMSDADTIQKFFWGWSVGDAAGAPPQVSLVYPPHRNFQNSHLVR